MNAMLIAAVAVTMCGIHFSVPNGWKASIETDTENKAVQCEIGIVPPHWPGREKSRWGAPDHPLRIELFVPKVSRDAVYREMEFETNEQGEVGVPGFRGVLDKAEPFHVGRLRGLQATPFARGYIKDQSLLRDGESRVFSTTTQIIVAKTPEGRWVGIECGGGTPDEGVDCDAAVPLFARTVRLLP